jgi:hypothetical protein
MAGRTTFQMRTDFKAAVRKTEYGTLLKVSLMPVMFYPSAAAW